MLFQLQEQQESLKMLSEYDFFQGFPSKKGESHERKPGVQKRCVLHADGG